jgi:hypothetical protein
MVWYPPFLAATDTRPQPGVHMGCVTAYNRPKWPENMKLLRLYATDFPLR